MANKHSPLQMLRALLLSMMRKDGAMAYFNMPVVPKCPSAVPPVLYPQCCTPSAVPNTNTQHHIKYCT